MKLIVAIIQCERLDSLRAVLGQTEATLAYISQVQDLRDQSTEVYRGVEYQAGRVKLRLEVLLLNDSLLDETVDLLASACSPREPIPGNIFVVKVEEWLPLGGNQPRLIHAGAAR